MRRSAFLLAAVLSLTALTVVVIHQMPSLCGSGGIVQTQPQLPGLVADSLRQPRYYTSVLRGPADSICASKHLRELYVFRHDTLLKIYRIALGHAPEGHKHFEGDERTPEGHYTIDGKNSCSSCHKNLGVSYPNAADKAYARRMGKSPGGNIKIHGLPNGQGHIGARHLLHNWTNGCMAVTDEEIDELYAHVATGVPILIAP